MRAVARDWYSAVASTTDWHAPSHVKRDLLLIGDQQVLHWRRDERCGIASILDGPGVIEHQQASGGSIVRCQVRHLHGEDGAGWIGQIADDGAVAGLADLEGLIGPAADLDPLLAHSEGARAVRRLVLILADGCLH